MAAGLTEDGAEQVRRAVYDTGLAGEAGRAGDEAGQLHDLDDVLQTDKRIDRGERVEGAALGELLGLLGGDAGADLAGGQQLALGHR
ncbi:hypothetical protein GCM10029963_51410 [Micromonospora andamanensis]